MELYGDIETLSRITRRSRRKIDKLISKGVIQVKEIHMGEYNGKKKNTLYANKEGKILVYSFDIKDDIKTKKQKTPTNNKSGTS